MALHGSYHRFQPTLILTPLWPYDDGSSITFSFRMPGNMLW
jgi:hypothetical protein